MVLQYHEFNLLRTVVENKTGAVPVPVQERRIHDLRSRENVGTSLKLAIGDFTLEIVSSPYDMCPKHVQ